MQNTIDRRDFLRTTAALGTGIGLAGLKAGRLAAAESGQGAPKAAKLGWRLGCTAYNFRRFTFHEAIDMNASLGLRYIEGFTWQKLGKENPKVQTNQSMPAALRKDLRKKLADAGAKMPSTYCRSLVGEEPCRKLFDFAKEMGIETLVGEPPLDPKVFDMLEKLCDQYQINLAVHNHPKSPKSKYWNPKTVLGVSKGRGKRIGACCDTGHWARSGIKPVDGLKTLEGRIISFHIKDITEFGNTKAGCVPVGTGEGDVAGVLKEIARQQLKPSILGIEYEHDTPKLMDEIAQSVSFVNKIAGQL